MAVIQYLVTVQTHHRSGARLTDNDLSNGALDLIADAASDGIAARRYDDDPAVYEVDQVTVEPLDPATEIALPLDVGSWRRLADALDVVTPPGAGSDERKLLDRLRAMLATVDQAERHHLSAVPDPDEPEQESEG